MLSDQGVAGIAQWIRRKGIVPRPGVTALQLPWLIARKIARDGTKAQPTRQQAKTSQEPRIHEHVRMATAQGQIGQASCRERVCQYVSILGGDVPLKKKKH